MRERPLVRRRFGVRATAPDAMARQFALVRGFRDLERTRVAVAAVVAVAIVAGIAVAVAAARPGLAATVAALVGSVGAFAAITFILSSIARPRDVARSLELYRWVGRADWHRFRDTTGDPAPTTPSRARAWLEAHPATDAADELPRIELLLWIGELDTARRAAAALPSDTPAARFDRALEVALVSFVGSGDGDLEAARSALDALDGEARTHAHARLAVEEARRLAAAKIAFLPPLLAARAAVGTAADGFLIPDLARWLARPFLVVGALSAILTFLVAGALPGR